MKRIVFTAILLSLVFTIAPALAAVVSIEQPNLPEVMKAAEDGDRDAQFEVGMVYYNGYHVGIPRDRAKALEWFLKAAGQGHDKAQFNAGLMYLNGDGTERDDAQAKNWFSKSAEQGHSSAQSAMGMMHKTGRGGEQDYAKAAEWYHKAAEQGDTQAQDNLGVLYRDGNGVAQDHATAAEWFAKAAAKGNSEAQLNLGVAYFYGHGVPKDDAKAAELFLQSANQGNMAAQYNIGLFLENGIGVAENKPEALEWFKKAAEQGHSDAREKTKQLASFADPVKVFFELCQKGTPQEVEEAIKNGADVNAKDKNGFTPLLYAAQSNGNPEVIFALIKAGVDVNEKIVISGESGTALMVAAVFNSNPEIITALIKAGADINAKTGNEETALILAAQMNNNPETITALLKNGADAKLKDNKGQMALDYAKINKSLENTEAFRELTARSAEPDATTGQSETQAGTGFSLTIDTGQGITPTGSGNTSELITGQGSQQAESALLLGDWGAPVPSDRDWTILVYLDGDNNLEESAILDMKELETGLDQNAKVDVVVLFDRAKGYDDSLGDWTGTRAYHVRPSLRNDDFDSELLADCGELNMGDPAILEAFIRAGLTKYPAPRVALFMWDHGGGWICMANDEDAPDAENGTDEITLSEFRSVLEHTAPLLPGGKFELIFFDMCLMGQAETAAACAPFAKYMVAGAPIIPGIGMDYAKALPLFQPGAATDRIAAEMVKIGCDGFLEIPYYTSSLTAFDLSKTEAFLEAFKSMAAKLSERIPETWGDVTRTLFFSLNYAGRSDYERGQGSCSSIDLLDWLTRMKKTVKNPPLEEIASLETAARMLIIAMEKGPEIPFCSGLSFYAPLRKANLKPDYAETDFNKRTGWIDILAKLHEMQAKDGMEPPKVLSIEFGVPDFRNHVEGKPLSGADLKLTPTDSVIPLSGKEEGGSWVKIVFEGKNILWGYMGMGMSDTTDKNGDYTMFMHSILMDENLDLDGSAKKQEEASNLADAVTPVFRDGRTELAYIFGGVTHRLANGEKSVLVTADYLDISDLKHFIIKGLYSDQQTGEVSVEASVNTDSYSIESITARADNGTVFAISPRPEGIFRPLLSKRDKDGNSRRDPGEEITWKDGLYIIMEPIPEGKFARIVAMAESIGGDGTPFISRPVAVKANPHIASHIDDTHREGWNRLLGRYSVLGPVPRNDNGASINAPMGSLINIQKGTTPNGIETLVAVQRIFDEAELTTYVTWQMEGLPLISRYVYDEETKDFILIERNTALLVLDGNSYCWRMNDFSDYSLFMLIPLDHPVLSPSILEGSWGGEDGSSLVFENGQCSYSSPGSGLRSVSGRYNTTGNMVSITPGGLGQPFTFYYTFSNQDNLVVTFKDTQTAMIYNRRQTIVKPQINLTGVWGAMINGQQGVMQVQLGPDQQTHQYQAWLNGMLFEAGVFQIQGNTMVGQTAAGMTYSLAFQYAPNGMSFSLTYPNGNMIVYQRVQ